MPCATLTPPTLPTLPAPIRLSLSVPDLPDLNFSLCCKLPPFPIDIPPLPIPAVIFNPALMATLNAYIRQINTYLNAIPLKCPLE